MNSIHNNIVGQYQFDNIPEELKRKDNWLVWRYQIKDGQEKPTKVPYDAKEVARIIKDGCEPIYCKADASNPHTWSTYSKALQVFNNSRSGCDGIGFCFDGEYIGIDLDGIEPGSLREYAAKTIASNISTYTELSPSGKGLHLILKADISAMTDKFIQKSSTQGIEIYSHPRYFTMTGNRLPEFPSTVENRQDQVNKFFPQWLPERKVAKSSLSSGTHSSIAEDQEIIDLCLSSDAFKRGFLGGYSEDRKSETAAAMVCVIARYSRDLDQITRILNLSYLFQNTHWSDKWEREDIQERQLDYAFSATEEAYEAFRYSMLRREVEKASKTLYEAPEPKPKEKPKDDQDEFAKKLEEAANKAQEQAEKTAATAYRFEPIDSATFDDTVYTMDWLVKGIMVQKQPTLIGGPQKSLKTNSIIDLVISIATGGKFLNKFQCVKKKICLVSGESGEFTIQETARRIAKSKGISLKDSGVHWDFRLPKLSIEEELNSLVFGILQQGFEVVVIDPLYLSLLSGSGGKINSSSAWDMGEKLKEVVDRLAVAGCQTLMCHHAKKMTENTYNHQPMELTDMLGAGVAEFARQWLLINRRESFNFDGKHKLWMVVGGSIGHGSQWALNIDEGELQEDFSGRKWEVSVMTKQEAKEAANLEKEETKNEDENTLKAELLAVVDTSGEISKTQLCKSLGWRNTKFERIYSALENAKILYLADGFTTKGNNARCPLKIVKRVEGT